MIIAFVIWSVAALLFFGISISVRKSKEAVGFFTFAKPPEVTDVCRYNHSVSLLWIIAAVIFEIIGIPFLFIKQNSPMVIFEILGVIVWAIGIMVGYLRIEAKYRR